MLSESKAQREDSEWEEGVPFYWELMEEDDGNLEELDDEELDKYIHTDEEAKLKAGVWEEMNKEWLAEYEGIILIILPSTLL